MANKQKYQSYEIGDIVKLDDYDMEIIDMKKERTKKSGQLKSYCRYKCHRCGFDCGEHYCKEELKKEYWVEKHTFNKNPHCICCDSWNSMVVVPHINSIVVTDKWMIPFFQGGYDEAKKYRRTFTKKINPVCPHCGTVSNTKTPIYNIYQHKKMSCKYCGDGIPYPERFLHSLLFVLNIEYISQFSKVNVEWCKDYRYDFYFEQEDVKYIIEVHGEQHYNKSKGNWKDLESIQTNDDNKRILAIKNDIKDENYIVIDCRKSDFNYIKTNILKSNLSKIFDLENIDWLKVEEMTLKNIVKVVCNLYNEGLTNLEITKKTGLCDVSVRNYLKKGNMIGWCDYDSKEYHKSISKPIAIYKDGVLLNTYSSIAKLCKTSEQTYGIKLHATYIKKCIDGEMNNYKGFSFQLT